MCKVTCCRLISLKIIKFWVRIGILMKTFVHACSGIHFRSWCYPSDTPIHYHFI
jgi:hypothetical protein